jgi:hypothetical protein
MGFMFSKPVGSSESQRIQSILEQISITDTSSPIFRMLQQLQEEISRSSSSSDYESDIVLAYNLRDLASQSMFTFSRKNQRDIYAIRPIMEIQRNEWRKHNYLQGLKKEEIQRIYRIYNLLVMILGLTALMTLEYTSSKTYSQLTGELNQNNHHLYRLFKYLRTAKGDTTITSKGPASASASASASSTEKKEVSESSVVIPYVSMINRLSSLYNEYSDKFRKEPVETILSVPRDKIFKDIHTQTDNFQGYLTFQSQKSSYTKGIGLPDQSYQSDKGYIPISTTDTQWLTFLETLFTLDTLGFCSPDSRYLSMVKSFAGGNQTDLAMNITNFIANLFGRDSPVFKSMYDTLKRTFGSYLRSKDLYDSYLTDSKTDSISLEKILQRPYSVLSNQLESRCKDPVNGIMNARFKESGKITSSIDSPFQSSQEKEEADKDKEKESQVPSSKRKIKMSSRHLSLIKEYNSMIMKLRASVIGQFNKVFVVDSKPDAYKVVFAFEDKESSPVKKSGEAEDKKSVKPPKKFLALRNQISLSSNPEQVLLGVLTKMLVDIFATHARMLERTHSILERELPAISKDYLKKPENVILLQRTAQRQSGYL